jgi:beta-ureidopropionase / N-carbamoyl-L-amino-acid hydrolase
MTQTHSLLKHQLLEVAAYLFKQIREATSDGVGVTRESYGRGESTALNILSDYATQQGLCCHFDQGANLIISLPDEPAGKHILIGSHLDSVPQGGNFDGLAGVVAGILILLHLKELPLSQQKPVRVLALRGEESAWFGKAYMGSLALLGKLTTEDLNLKARDTGQHLRQAMAELDIPIHKIEDGEPLIDLATVAAYLELHIEQGPIMVARKWPIAAVSGIRGNIRHNRILCKGETGHSGAVPRWMRKDAVLACAELLSRLDEHWRVLQQMGMDLVMTSGIFSTNPASHALSVIPGEVHFSFEVRSQDDATLEQFYQLMQSECRDIARSRGVEFVFDRKLYTAPALMSEDWLKKMMMACEHLNITTEVVASGAGHDAAVFANAGIPSGMIFIRNEHGSHNPHEAMDLEDFFLGVQALNIAIHA